jgi:integrase
VISPGVRLGYRRGRGTNGRGGTWLAASRAGDGKRVQARLGRADDATPADGVALLTHEQAKEAARAWVKAIRTGAGASPALTVNAALDRYFEARAAEGMKSLQDAKTRAALHIRPTLGELRLSELTVDRVRKWRDGMVSAPKRFRTRRFAEQPNARAVDLSDPEIARRRRDTANRMLTTLKAALNWSRDHRLTDDDTAWRLVKPYRSTTAARVRFLSTAEQQRLLDSAAGDLRDLIAAALMTGARFGELARLTVRDFDGTNGSVFVAESKSGKARHIPLTAGGLALFVRLAADRPAASPLLTRNGQRWERATISGRSRRRSLPRAGKHHPSRTPAFLCQHHGPGRRAADSGGAGARPLRYPDGRQALCAPGAVLRGRRDPEHGAGSCVSTLDLSLIPSYRNPLTGAILHISTLSADCEVGARPNILKLVKLTKISLQDTSLHILCNPDHRLCTFFRFKEKSDGAGLKLRLTNSVY